ncbi:hypothetical protein VNI00_013579 [Paramarasmius palmivorus]|uniref:Uncharacterized protein n=1 Tax=Paramarasmius palmivorus TaxID=297713 RepID=A0AAW0BY96_9AGAR
MSTTMDLHDIALLLNYERATTETRYRGAKLREVARNGENFKTVLVTLPDWYDHKGPRVGFVFDKPARAPEEPDLPSNMLPPNSTLELSDKELETIFYQARAHDGCFVSIGLLQLFFDLFPNENDISLRVRMPDGTEYHSPASLRVILEAPILLPKQLTVAMVLPENMSYITGGEDTMPHAVWGFTDDPQGNIKTVLDMSSIQFGEEGRGLKGKSLFALGELRCMARPHGDSRTRPG